MALNVEFQRCKREAKATGRSLPKTPIELVITVACLGFLFPLGRIGRRGVFSGAATKRPHEEPRPEMGGLWDSIKQTSQLSRVPKLLTPTMSVGTKQVKVMDDLAGGSRPFLRRALTTAPSGQKLLVVRVRSSW
jgi:hypothetical protein